MLNFQLHSFRLLSFVLLCVALVLTGCSTREDREQNIGAEELYEQAQRRLASQNYQEAIRLYRMLTVRFPFGRHAEQAMLDMAFAQYKGGESEESINTLERFLRTYPTHPNVDYAWYLKGLVNYDLTMGFLRQILPGRASDRDQQSAHEAFRDFQELIRRHPDSRYVPDTRQRMVFLRNIMADYEIEVGEYYARRNAWIAALNRARYVIETYPGAPATVDALELMARSYSRLGMAELAADTREVLEYNYAELIDDEKRPGLLSRLWPFD